MHTQKTHTKAKRALELNLTRTLNKLHKQIYAGLYFEVYILKLMSNLRFMNIYKNPKALINQCLCARVTAWRHWYLFLFAFLFYGGVESITALEEHLRKVMPCSHTLNSAE